jgi:hypothetical protein
MKLRGYCLATGAYALASSLMATAQDHQLGQPHLLVEVSAGLVNAIVHQKVDRTEAFEDVIKDVPNSGVHRTIGSVRAELVPAAGHAACDLVFTGCTYARAIGFKRIAQLHTATATSFDVRYRLALDAWGFRGCMGPSSAQAHITLLGVVDRFGEHDSTATNVVRLGFNGDREEAESIVAGRTRWRTSGRMEAELAPKLRAANQALAAGYAWARDAGLRFESLDYQTTPANLQARLRLATPGRPGPTVAPAAPPDGDLRLRVHQSLFTEGARTALGGKTLHVAELMEVAERLTAPFLRDARTESDRDAGRKAMAQLLAAKIGKSATLTLAADDPIRVSIATDAISIEIRIAAGHVNDIALAGARLKAVYRVENTATGAFLARHGPIEIRPVDPAKKGQTLFAPLVRVLAAEILKQRMALADLPYPADLIARRLRADDGWLTAIWKLR